MMVTFPIFLKEYIFIGMLIAYLLGSIPFGVLVSRRFTHIDIRQHGSHNTGAINVMRVAGYFAGILTLIADTLKGAFPVALYLFYISKKVTSTSFDPILISLLIALCATAGHMFPLYSCLRKGGKGVATTFGGLSIISPVATGCALCIYLLVFWLFKKASLSSLIASVSLLFLFPFLKGIYTFPVVFILVILIFIRHRTNILRLFSDTEPNFKRQI